MSFRPEPDVSVADWWLAPGGPGWGTVCTHGPPGFAAYVRFRHHDQEAHHEAWVLELVAEALAGHTTTPDDVVVALWDGSSQEVDLLHRSVRDGAKARLVAGDAAPMREYHLLRGPLAALGDWPAHDPDHPPAFPELVCGAMWPEDRAWCYAWDTDDDGGATLACDEALAARLLTDGRYAAWRVGRGGPDPPGRLVPTGR